MGLFEHSFTNNMFTKKTARQKGPWQHTFTTSIFTTTTKNKYSRKKSFKRRNIEIMLTLLHLNG